jgi:hypothetical protein
MQKRRSVQAAARKPKPKATKQKKKKQRPREIPRETADVKRAPETTKPTSLKY